MAGKGRGGWSRPKYSWIKYFGMLHPFYHNTMFNRTGICSPGHSDGASRAPGVSISAMFSIAAMCLMSLPGCGDANRQIYPVSGVVRFPDGKLLRSGSVEFEIIGRKPPITATGVISSDGRFVLGTNEIDDGALIGKHRVVVVSYHNIGNGAERPGRIPKAQLHPRYSQYRTSGLTWDVKAEENEVVIEVEYADDLR